MSNTGVVPSYRLPEGPVTRVEGGWVQERRLYRVKWVVLPTGTPMLTLEKRIQKLSDDGWTVFQVLPDERVIAYRYQVAEGE